MHVDINFRFPRPQETEQGGDSVHDDQAGHDCVLHDSFLVRFEDPLSNERNVDVILRSSFSQRLVNWYFLCHQALCIAVTLIYVISSVKWFTLLVLVCKKQLFGMIVYVCLLILLKVNFSNPTIAQKFFLSVICAFGLKLLHL